MTSLNILKNKEVLFFIDTNKKNGFGHMQRCLRFSSVFSNFDKVLVSNKKIKLKNFKYLNFNDFLKKKKEYDFGVIDNYNVNFNTEKKIKSKIKNLITIDDLANRRFASDFIINYDPNIKRSNYTKKIKRKAVLLIGKNFNFFNNFKFKKKKINRKKLNILIYQGQKDRAKKICNILQNLEKDKIKNIYILSKYKFLYKGFNLKFKFYENYKDTQKLISKCDVIIVSSGIIIYEALSLKKLIFSNYISKNQKSNFKFLTKNNYVEQINDLKNLNKKINYFNNSSNKNFFKNYSVIELLKTIFFGIKNKNNYHISLFNFETDDIKNIYKLQTPENRKYFKENKTFSYKHHVKYLNKFNKVQSNFILTIKKNFFKTIGYTKFEEYKKKIFISIMLEKKYQQQGIGQHVLKILNSKKFSNTTFYAEVKKNNLKSINAFVKAGFVKNKNLKII